MKILKADKFTLQLVNTSKPSVDNWKEFPVFSRLILKMKTKQSRTLHYPHRSLHIPLRTFYRHHHYPCYWSIPECQLKYQTQFLPFQWYGTIQAGVPFLSLIHI